MAARTSLKNSTSTSAPSSSEADDAPVSFRRMNACVSSTPSFVEVPPRLRVDFLSSERPALGCFLFFFPRLVVVQDEETALLVVT